MSQTAAPMRLHTQMLVKVARTLPNSVIQHSVPREPPPGGEAATTEQNAKCQNRVGSKAGATRKGEQLRNWTGVGLCRKLGRVCLIYWQCCAALQFAMPSHGRMINRGTCGLVGGWRQPCRPTKVDVQQKSNHSNFPTKRAMSHIF